MSMLDLHLDLISKPPVAQNTPVSQAKGDITWLKIANMQASAFAVNKATRKLVAVVSHDREVCEAVGILASAKQIIKTHGATESIMAFFNNNNQLANCIGMEIPQITEANAAAVGVACCESIDATVVTAYDKVKEFFDALISTANNFFDKLKEQTSRQSEAIDSVVENIINTADKEDTKSFTHNEAFGYSQPVFMDRVNALQFINNHLAVCEANNESMLQFAPALKTLGYKIVEKSSEGLYDGEVNKIESELQIVPETAEDAPAEGAPAGGEAPAPAPEGGEQAAPAPEGGAPAGGEGGAPAPAAESMQTTSAYMWNINSVREAALAIKAALVGSERLTGVTNKLGEIKGTVVSAIESVITDESANKLEADATITTGRRYAAFIGDILAIYSGASNELVDQVVCLSAKLVAELTKNEEVPAAPAEGAPAPEGGAPAEGAPAPEGGAPAEGAPAGGEGGGAPAAEGSEPAAPAGEGGGEGAPAPAEGAPAPAEGEQPAEGAPAPAANGVESPKNVPQADPVKPNAPVCPNGEPDPGKAPHIQPVETPESQQPSKKTEKLLDDVEGTRLW